MDLELKKHKKFLLFLFFISLFVRAIAFIYFFSQKDLLKYDSAVYNNVAEQIAQGKGIAEADGSPHFYRVPGYSLFLSLGYKFLGNDIKKILWIQILLSCLIPILIFCLAFVLFPGKILLAKVCSVLSVFHVGFVTFSDIVMAESLFVLFFLIFLILFLPEIQLWFCKSVSKISFIKIFSAGIFLGLASLTRPVGHYLLLVGLLLLLFSGLRFNLKIKSSLFLFLGWLLIVSWWLIRNFILTGYLFFHTLPGVHFLKHSAARIEMEAMGCSYQTALQTLVQKADLKIKDQEKKIKRPVNGIEYCIIAEKVSYDCFRENRFLALKNFFINMFKTCFSLYSAELLFFDSDGALPDYEKDRNIFLRFLFPLASSKFLAFLIYLEIIFLLLLWVGFCGFVFLSFLNREYFCLLLKVLPFIGFFVVASLACGFARMRLPIEPFLIIFSIKFWLEMFTWKFCSEK